MDFLFEVGPAESNGLGNAPISHSELAAWQMNTCRRLQPWEISIMRRLSYEWIAESQRAEAMDCPPPWGGEEVSSEELRAVADTLRESVRAMAKG